MMMAEFDRMTKELESQIVVEEKKSGISDPSHFAYPTFAKAARQRADNLQVSIRELQVQEEALENSLEEMQAEYARPQRSKSGWSGAGTRLRSQFRRPFGSSMIAFRYGAYLRNAKSTMEAHEGCA